MSKLNIRSALFIASAIMGLARAGHADDSFCDSQLKLAIANLGPIPHVGYEMVTLKLGEAPCFIHSGEITKGSGVAPDANTIFELASMTKVFTTAILAMRTLGSNGLNAYRPVKPADLPPGFKLEPDEEKVTFQQLATFTGGFSWSDPPCCKTGNGFNPSYSQDKFEDAVSHLQPKPADAFYPQDYPLPTYQKYSNSSVGFLGQILMNMDSFPIDSTGVSFELWIWKNLTGRLGMNNTAVNAPGQWATGYAIEGGTYQPQPPFPWEPWGAAGALRSNANDMLKFLKANICAHHKSDPDCTGFPKDILDALEIAHTPNTYYPNPSLLPVYINLNGKGPAIQAWAWVYLPPAASTNNGTPIIEKNGGHPGFSTFIGFNPDKKYGLVILMNTHQEGLTDAGIDIIQHTP